MLRRTLNNITSKYGSYMYKNMYNNKYIHPTNYCKYSTINNIEKTLIENYIKNLELEYKSISEKNLLTAVTEKRIQELSGIMRVVQDRNHITEHINSLDELLCDKDENMKKLAEEEKYLYQEKLATVEHRLLESLIPTDMEDLCDSIVLEINAGVGGQEAMLFAHELFEMYVNFAGYKDWTCQIVEFVTTDLGGVRHASMFINGPGVFQFFKYEAGVHRVQRIPATERSGRVHTSTVSIVALPQPRDIDITIHDKDLRVETKRASGAGGQHVNTTDSAVRIVHLPTNLAVECQVDRSQIKNREIAMQRLKAKLYEQQINTQQAESDAKRKSQVRSNYRNEKIRTYNYSQDRITDHRLQSSNIHNLKGFLLGGQQLENLIKKLHSTAQHECLMKVLNSVQTNQSK